MAEFMDDAKWDAGRRNADDERDQIDPALQPLRVLRRPALSIRSIQTVRIFTRPRVIAVMA